MEKIVVLNGFEGWDVLNFIKSKYPHMPVLIVSAYDNYIDDPRVSQADGYWIKNFYAFDNLKKKIAEIVICGAETSNRNELH